jgi:4-amino-4-deoxy-L-arabinose transferase-like glycosyltransferase
VETEETVINDVVAGPVKHRVLALFAWILVTLLLIAASTVRLESVPPVGWDEGWTMSVARHWVERGFYGRLLSGNEAQPGLNASFTVTGLVALAFRFLGVGIWQARIVGVCFLVGAVALIYLLAERLYGHVIANVTLAVLFLTAPLFPQLHPLIMARQVLGEIPMLFFILGGYFCFYIALSGSLWFLPAAALFWALGVITKAQTLPFFGVSLLLPLALTMYSRQWRSASIITVGLASTLLMAKGLLWLQTLLLQHQSMPRTQLVGVYGVIAFVPNLKTRSLALEVSVFLLPAILGVFYEAKKTLRRIHWSRVRSEVDIIRLMLLGFTGSWLIWYVLLSNSYPRYAFPANFVASIFVAQLLRDLIDSRVDVFTWTKTDKIETKKLLQGRVWRERLLAILLIAVWSCATLEMLYRAYVVDGSESAMQVAAYLNTQTPKDTLIETYDSEIHFLLNRRYHYPPDEIIVDLIQRAIVGYKQRITIEYDALEANPDYLVVGHFIKGLGLYTPVLHGGAFRLIRSIKEYDIYQRVR